MEGTIRSYQSVIETFKFQEPADSIEMFAQQRYLKKMEVPMKGRERMMKKHCARRWLISDQRLPNLRYHRYNPLWVKARALIHQWLRPYKTSDLRSSDFRWPKGSEFDKFIGISLEARLGRKTPWSCTHDNVDEFVALAYNNHGLKHAVKKRFKAQVAKLAKRSGEEFADCYRYVNNYFYQIAKNSHNFTNIGYVVFKHKCLFILQYCYGSRLGSVPKNNKVRRPINIEPFCNLLTQSQVGVFLRRVLNEQLGYDLDTIAAYHRLRIADPKIATIDESNASDNISLELVDYLFPSWFVTQLKKRRSPMVLTDDLGYYIPKKLSSMGNGFTFEVLTFINLALCRTVDDSASVFGDDIICRNECARSIIEALTSVGFIVNNDKTFIDSPFRESCGAFYQDGHGYIESYDFKWPTTIGECVMLCNKAARLARIYPSFGKLYQQFVRSTPPALRGYEDKIFLGKSYLSLFQTSWEHDRPSIDIPPYFVASKPRKTRVDVKEDSALGKALTSYCLKANDIIVAFDFKPLLRTPCRVHIRDGDWAKYLAYLYAGRKSKDTLRDGHWVPIKLVVTDCGRNLPVAAVLRAEKRGNC